MTEIPHDCLNELNVVLQVGPTSASLELLARMSGADDTPVQRGVIELSVDPLLGRDDPRLRILRAMEVAAANEIDRLQLGETAQLVHLPQPLDLTDLQQFPPSTTR